MAHQAGMIVYIHIMDLKKEIEHLKEQKRLRVIKVASQSIL